MIILLGASNLWHYLPEVPFMGKLSVLNIHRQHHFDHRKYLNFPVLRFGFESISVALKLSFFSCSKLDYQQSRNFTASFQLRVMCNMQCHWLPTPLNCAIKSLCKKKAATPEPGNHKRMPAWRHATWSTSPAAETSPMSTAMKSFLAATTRRNQLLSARRLRSLCLQWIHN